MRAPVLAALVVLAALAGCAAPVTQSELEWTPERAYQTIANALPDADAGFGEAPPPDLAPSVRAEGPRAPEDLKVFANEGSFRIRVELLRARVIEVPYAAIDRIDARWCPFPDVLFAALLVVPLQATEARIVFDARKIPGLLGQIERACDRLERLSGETSIASFYYHADRIRRKIRDDARELGDGRISVAFVSWSPVPSWIPYLGPSRRLGDAFAWAREHAR